MLVEPVNNFSTNIQMPIMKKLNVIDITPLLPKAPKAPTLWDSVFPKNDPFADLFNILNNIVQAKIVSIQILNPSAPGIDQDSGADYERYLQFPNSELKALAASIVSTTDTNDAKMYKIEQWVINNIEYVSDAEQYEKSELWAYPTMTINNMKGDCEDGAFLLHSLALNAGVPNSRLRTYGGLVVTSSGTGIGGHAWTAYQRETDNEWIVLDWCYWATSKPFSERQSMSANLKYIDDFFFVEATKTVETPYTNRVRFATPDIYLANTRPLFIDVVA